MDQSRSVLPLRSVKPREFGELWREKCTRASRAFHFKLERTSSFRPVRPDKSKATLEKSHGLWCHHAVCYPAYIFLKGWLISPEDMKMLVKNSYNLTLIKAGFHFGEFGRATKRWEYQGMRSLKSKLKASVYWRTRSQFWKLNQLQLFCDQNERKPIRFLLFNARACDRTGSRDWIRWSGNRT